MLRYTPVPLVYERLVDVCDRVSVRVRPAVGVLSEVPVTIGVPNAAETEAIGGNQLLAIVLTNSVVVGRAYGIQVGSLMNKSSCLGIGTLGGEIPETRAEGYQLCIFAN